MINLRIENLSERDWKTYKELRLLSLIDSPDSFGSTYEQKENYPDSEWIARLNKDRRVEGSFPIYRTFPLIAVLNNKPSGLAWGLVHNPEDKVGHVYQMWVSPSARGHGLGKLLLDRIVSWAKASGLNALILSVTTTNRVAKNLYKSAGFVETGKLEGLRNSSSLLVQPMKLDLRGNIR